MKEDHSTWHLSDASQLKPSSHILKHYLEYHEEERLEDVRFGMVIRKTAMTAFERQIQESVLIQQENLKHNILNSKSEYNRCALPRLTTKLGDSDFEAWKVEQFDEKKKEEELESKIRYLRRQRNKERQVSLQTLHAPAPKRRKIAPEQFKSVGQLLKGWVKERRCEERETVERKEVDHPERKKRKIQEETVVAQQIHPVQHDPLPLVDLPPHGDDQEVDSGEQEGESRDWDKEICLHRQEIEGDTCEESKETTDYNTSWELMKHLTDYLRENEPELKRKAQKRETERERETKAGETGDSQDND